MRLDIVIDREHVDDAADLAEAQAAARLHDEFPSGSA